MSNLSKFWNAIESLPSLAAVEAEWQHLLGCEYRLAKSFLRATQKVALSLPAADGNRHYEVVEHGRDDLVGICQETGETITLTRNQLAVYELDQQRLAVQVANTLGLSAANRVATKDIRLFSLGTFRPTTHSVTAFLMVPSDAAAVAAAAAWLISQGASPFLIITPTRSFVTGELILRLRSLGSASLSLADALVVCDNGKWAISDGAVRQPCQIVRSKKNRSITAQIRACCNAGVRSDRFRSAPIHRGDCCQGAGKGHRSERVQECHGRPQDPQADQEQNWCGRRLLADRGRQTTRGETQQVLAKLRNRFDTVCGTDKSSHFRETFSRTDHRIGDRTNAREKSL